MARKSSDPGNTEDRERVDERRRHILAAAATVFARSGYHKARTREIAEEAGISEGTIYNYYGNKRELLIALIERIVRESLLATTLPANDENPKAWLTTVLHDRLRVLDRYRDLMTAVTPEMINDKTLQEEYLHQVLLPILMQFLPLAQRYRDMHLREFNPLIVLPAILGGTISAFIFNELGDSPLGYKSSREDLIDEMVSLFIDGLRKRDDVTAAGPPASGPAGSGEGSDTTGSGAVSPGGQWLPAGSIDTGSDRTNWS